MKIRYALYLVLLTVLSSFTDPGKVNYRKVDDGVVIQVEKTDAGAAQLVKLRVISDRIIHVLATPGEDLDTEESLMIIDGLQPSMDWELTENENSLTLTTKALQVQVNASTGEVTFFDRNGNAILQEKNGDKATFSPVELEGETKYRLHKAFNTTEDEAFYGLGQHQTAQMNYKGYQVDLTQYNGVAVVPFLVSSKNYGILWDNNSISKFGDVREYQPLSAFTLYNKEGEEGGLTATYTSQESEAANPVIRQESEIDYEFLSSLDKMPEDFNLDHNSIIRWEGAIESQESGEHHFRLQSSGYVKVRIDGELLIDKWREAWNPGPAVFAYPLEQGRKHSIEVEWIPDGGEAFIALTYLTPQSEEAKKTFAFTSEAGDAVDYYFVHGDKFDDIIKGYRHLTGKAQVMPKWAMGFWQSRERYKTQEELLETVKEFREREIPLDNIVLDWSYWEEDAWGSHEFDKERFPDPEGMIDDIHNKYNAQIMISVWPKFYEGIENYQAFNEKGLLYTQNIRNRQRDWIGEGYVSTFYDAYNPEARELFWEQLNENLYQKGIDAWWLDATEPDILSNASIEHRKTLMNPTALGSAEEYFNAYSLMNAKGIYEGQREENPDDRVFILTRSAFAGLQRYGAATWSGDISSRFDEMARQIPGGLNFALSGLPYWTTDIGGFFVENKYDRPDPQGEDLEEWRELNARWYQYGAFLPLFRAHGQYPYREVFNIAPEDHPAYQSIVYYNKLRYRLMPYIYTLTGKVYHDDYTMMRALVMDFPEDKRVREIGTQYMFGPSLLINPVTEYKARTKELYLPATTGWYNLYDGTYQEGGQQIEADAPYERMPIYVKEGSIIPFGPEIQYTGEKPADTITLYVYGGKDASFELYEDENTNYNYENGKYSLIPISYDERSKTLKIGKRQGEFEGMLENRTFNIVLVNKDSSAQLDFDQKPARSIKYSGKAKSVKLR